jgi:hypothetical protein
MQKILQQAIAFYQQNKFTDALSLLQKFNQISTNKSSISLQLEAICLANQGDLKSALTLITKAIPIAVNPQEKQQASNLYNQFKLALKQQNRSGEHLSNAVCKAQFHGSDDNVINIAQQLVNYLVSLGAKFNKGITFIENSGVLSITSTAANNQIHLQIPLVCMPMLVDYEFSIDPNKKLQIKPKESLLNPKAAPVIDLMVQLFNATDKLANWEKSFPFFVYQDWPEIIEQLFSFRSPSNKLASFYDHFQKREWDVLLIESFIGSREFTYQQNHLKAANIKSSNNSEKGLLAIIDFLNHRVGDGGYIVNTQSRAMEIVGNPDKESKELFVQYGMFDPFLTYFIYGFVDTHAPFIYSGKCEIDLISGNKLVVLSMSGGIKRATPLPAALSHLKEYLPPGIKKQGNAIVVSDIIVPKIDNSMLLREVLEQILIMVGCESNYKSIADLENEITHIIKVLVEKNIQFWQGILGEVKELNIEVNDLLILSEHSIKHFKQYI